MCCDALKVMYLRAVKLWMWMFLNMTLKVVLAGVGPKVQCPATDVWGEGRRGTGTQTGPAGYEGTLQITGK